MLHNNNLIHNTTMKKLFFFLIGATFACTGFAQGSCVTAKQVSANYVNNTVTFELTWKLCSSTTTHLNRAWVFVDIQPVDPATGNKDAWTPASYTGKPTVDNADTLTVPGNTRGFYVTGNNGQSATVTMQINTTLTKFNWCAFATDYPPNIGTANTSTRDYTLRGTQSFVVNGKTITGKQTSGSVSSLTDATGCPGCIAVQDFKFSGSSVTIPCCPNLTPLNGHCRDLAADDASASWGCDLEWRFGASKATSCGSWTWVDYTTYKCLAQEEGNAAIGWSTSREVYNSRCVNSSSYKTGQCRRFVHRSPDYDCSSQHAVDCLNGNIGVLCVCLDGVALLNWAPLCVQ